MNPKRFSYENKSYEAWIRKQPCFICGSSEVVGHHMYHAKRNSFLLTPLCVKHHTFGKDSYHALEHQRFQEAHNKICDWEVINLLSKFIQENLPDRVWVDITEKLLGPYGTNFKKPKKKMK